MENVVRVLLLEDDAVDRLVFLRTLRRSTTCRYEVQTIECLAELPTAIEARQPDIVVLDLNVPDGNGLQTFLNARRHTGRLPCVVLTGMDDRSIGTQALQQGAQDFLVKGEFSPAQLERALAHAIARSQLVQVVASAALHDELTGLPNRLLAADRLQTAVRRAQRQDERLAVIFVDLDRFKPINDLYGHHVGDAVLCAVAGRLRSALRASDTVARWGGDEFVCVIDNVGDLPAARQVAAKLLRAVVEPMRFATTTGDPLHVEVSASIGVAYFPDHAHDADELLQCSDAAMYAAKQAKGGVVLWGSEGMRALSRKGESRVLVTTKTPSSDSSAMLSALGHGGRD